MVLLRSDVDKRGRVRRSNRNDLGSLQRRIGPPYPRQIDEVPTIADVMKLDYIWQCKHAFELEAKPPSTTGSSQFF